LWTLSFTSGLILSPEPAISPGKRAYRWQITDLVHASSAACPRQIVPHLVRTIFGPNDGTQAEMPLCAPFAPGPSGVAEVMVKDNRYRVMRPPVSVDEIIACD
jgi:hypothetical protein